MKEIKIFLAHTKEVNDDIKEIKLKFNNKEYENYQVKTKIDHWSDADKSVTKERFQDILNERIGTSDILYVFFENRIGKFTKEEFEYGLERFKKNQKPYKISVFAKEYNLHSDASKEEYSNVQEVRKFTEYIKNINTNQYLYSYENIDNLINQLSEQIEIDIKKVLKIQKDHKNNPSHLRIKFEGTCTEDIIPIAVKVLKTIYDYIEKNVCFPCINVQYNNLKENLLEKFEDEALQLSIKYLSSNSCIVFFKKEDLYGNQVQYIKLTSKGDEIIRLRYD